jgi:membrane dipeptidase
MARENGEKRESGMRTTRPPLDFRTRYTTPMPKRLALLVPLLALAFAALPAASATQHKKPARPASTAAHVGPVTVDTHADTPSAYMEHAFDLSAWNKSGHFDYARMKAGGLNAEFFAAYVPARYAHNGAAAYCVRLIETIHEMVDGYPQLVRFATSTTDIRNAVHDGRGAILIGIEGGHAIENSLELLRAFYRSGARYMTLTHTNSNDWADSSGDEPKHNGLTPFGREVVLEMNRLGMLVDISHVSDKTFYDVLETTRAPVIASHSSARALCAAKRNMTDDMLRALAKNGGVADVNFYPEFLSDDVLHAAEQRDEKLKTQIADLKAKFPDEGPEFDSAERKLNAENPLPPVSYTRIVDHIDHMVKVAGIDHVGIGSDFDGISAVPQGMEDVSKLPAVRTELKRRGYSDADIHKIMGENFMRVFAEVERVRREMSK